MPATLNDILGPEGAIARRLGDKYEHRPQQMEMATAVQDAFAKSEHLLVEAGTGVGKSFAYLLPAIDAAVRQNKRVVISTHTISLQEQLIEKDIPLLRSVYPDEFVAVLVKGRSNYLCQRRLKQSRGRQNYLFTNDKELESLWMVEEWAQKTTDGSLADLPILPETQVWDKVCAEHGNCLGKRCEFYNKCFWQAAKRRMNGAKILVVNHALFFSDLGLRMAGVNYLPKYDHVILDEAHTIEDVAGQHFGVRISEGQIKYNLRSLYDLKKGRGMLNSHGSIANDAIADVIELHERTEHFFEEIVAFHESRGRSNGRVQEKNIVENILSPKFEELAKHMSAMLTQTKDPEEMSEITSLAEKVRGMGRAVDAIISQQLEDAVYWFDVAGRSPKRVSLHAAPVNVAEGLRRNLFEKVKSVVMTSATLCTAAERKRPPRGMGAPPMQKSEAGISVRQGANLPHWESANAIYSITFRLADSMPGEILAAWQDEHEKLLNHELQNDGAETSRTTRVRELQSLLDRYLDAGHGDCSLARNAVATLVAETIKKFDEERYVTLAWCIMPNHVHLIIQPLGNHSLSDILHSIKSWTAKEANRLLGREGVFWQAESYDHLIRDEEDLGHQVEYVWSNPDQAGLEDYSWRFRDDERILKAVNQTAAAGTHGRGAHATEEAAAKKVENEPVPPEFAYIARRLGIDKTRTLQLGSPFDYETQATLYIESDLPEPSDPRFLDLACDKIIQYLAQTNGGAFVLFTSYKMLVDCANRLKDRIEVELGFPMLVQGQGAPRRVLLERFRQANDSVLFGTSSFWQGIDVQGEQLRNVIIVKLPFAVPDEPVVEARLEAITREGGNAFMEYSVPEAIIKLKQGFGRLIRSRTDKGIVVILDSRVKSKRYGKLFLESLPQCRIGTIYPD